MAGGRARIAVENFYDNKPSNWKRVMKLLRLLKSQKMLYSLTENRCMECPDFTPGVNTGLNPTSKFGVAKCKIQATGCYEITWEKYRQTEAFTLKRRTK